MAAVGLVLCGESGWFGCAIAPPLRVALPRIPGKSRQKCQTTRADGNLFLFYFHSGRCMSWQMPCWKLACGEGSQTLEAVERPRLFSVKSISNLRVFKYNSRVKQSRRRESFFECGGASFHAPAVESSHSSPLLSAISRAIALLLLSGCRDRLCPLCRSLRDRFLVLLAHLLADAGHDVLGAVCRGT